jgi:hypothetical protein
LAFGPSIVTNVPVNASVVAMLDFDSPGVLDAVLAAAMIVIVANAKTVSFPH